MPKKTRCYVSRRNIISIKYAFLVYVKKQRTIGKFSIQPRSGIEPDKSVLQLFRVSLQIIQNYVKSIRTRENKKCLETREKQNINIRTRKLVFVCYTRSKLQRNPSTVTFVETFLVPRVSTFYTLDDIEIILKFEKNWALIGDPVGICGSFHSRIFFLRIRLKIIYQSDFGHVRKKFAFQSVHSFQRDDRNFSAKKSNGSRYFSRMP